MDSVPGPDEIRDVLLGRVGGLAGRFIALGILRDRARLAMEDEQRRRRAVIEEQARLAAEMRAIAKREVEVREQFVRDLTAMKARHDREAERLTRAYRRGDDC
jgi:hypothetical protein